jgi:predicted nucleotidyltransferase
LRFCYWPRAARWAALLTMICAPAQMAQAEADAATFLETRRTASPKDQKMLQNLLRWTANGFEWANSELSLRVWYQTTPPNRAKMHVMNTTFAMDPALRRFREALTELYGPALERVMLFGSPSRGETGTRSDYDIAVFLNDVQPGMTEWYRLADLRQRFLDAGGPFFDAIPFRSSDYDRPSPIMHEIRRDGIAL